jgi:hypothetical protein
MSSPPRVSVCLPVYNGASYLGASIASVLAQTWRDLRLIVVDNGSTDATPDVVRRFADPRIAYHRNDRNIGLVANFNRCLDLADGELACIWHHDDVMLPDNLARKVAFLDAHPSVVFVHSNLWLVDGDGRRTRQHWHEDSRQDYVRPGLAWLERFAMELHLGALVFIGAALARRTAYELAGRFRSELPNCCDNEMWMRLALSGDVGCLAEPLVEYRKYGKSVSGAHAPPDWLAEHFAAARSALTRHGDRVPRAAALLDRVRAAFAEEAMVCAHETSYQLRLGESRRYLGLAARLAPSALASRRFWWLLARGALGVGGVRLYERLRGAAGPGAR